MKKTILFVAALICGIVANVSAQEVAAESIDARITKNEKRTEVLEKRTATLEKLRQYLRINGFIQGAYDWNDDREDNNSTGVSTFHLRRARLSLTGDLYKGAKGAKIDYRLYFDLVRVKLPNPNPILDMWIRYQPVKEFGIKFGQFKNPITFEASIAPNRYDFIDFSYAVCNLAKMGSNDVLGLNVTARDAGFQLYGGFIHREGYSILNYDIGVLNGNGINTKDDNKTKDVFAKFTVKPTKDLALALYYQWGEANLSKSANYADYKWTGSAEYVVTHRWGGGFNYDGKKAFARGEYIAGLSGNLPSEGMYIEGGKRFHLPKNMGVFWAGAMVDYFCRDTFNYIERDTRNAIIDMRYSLCLGFEPVKYFRVQLAYSLEHRINHTFANNRPFGNGVKLLVTGAF